MAKTLYNPDRSTFVWAYSNKPYKIKPGKNTFPDRVADHLLANTAQWGVVLYEDDESINTAKIIHTAKLTEHYKDILKSFAVQNKDLLAAGLNVPRSAEVQEAESFLATVDG